MYKKKERVMEYRILGKTGLKVSEIGFGGEWVGGYSLEEVKNLTDCCEENGITLSNWKKNLSDDLKKKYEEATAKFLEACEKIK